MGKQTPRQEGRGKHVAGESRRRRAALVGERVVMKARKTKHKPLEVFILQAGTVRKIRLPDPRLEFCREFNRHATRFGMVAVLSPTQRRSASPAR